MSRGKRNHQICRLLCFVCMFAVSALSFGQSTSAIDIFITPIKPISSHKILPNDVVDPTLVRSTLSVSLTPSEFESASVVIRNDSTEVKGLDFSVEYGPRWPAGIDIDLRYVLTWYQAESAWEDHWRRSVEERKLVPELIVKDATILKVDHVGKRNYLKLSESGDKYIDVSSSEKTDQMVLHDISEFGVKDAITLSSISIKPSENQQIWLNVFANSDVNAGNYEANLVIKSGSSEIRYPIFVEVLPFYLKESRFVHSIYYRGQLTPDSSGTVSSEYKTVEQLKSELENLRAHGITNPSIYQSANRKGAMAEVNRSTRLSFIEKYLNIRKSVGYEDTPIYFLGVTTSDYQDNESIEQVWSVVADVKSIVENHGAGPLYVYGKDESQGDALLAQEKVWNYIRDRGVKIFVAGYDGHVESPIGPSTDLLIYHDELKSGQLERMHGYGNLIFKYHDPKSGPENPELFRYKRGLYLWQSDFDGSMDYVYQHSFGSIWNDFDHARYRDEVFAYPTVNGVIDTLAWEGYREGIDDLRYLTTLEIAVEDMQSSPLPNQGWLDLVYGYLDYLKAAGATDLDSFRDTVISHLKGYLDWKHGTQSPPMSPSVIANKTVG